MKYALRALFALATGAVTIWSFYVPDALHFQYPEMARMFFFHFPCPLMLTLMLFMGCLFSLFHFVEFKGGKLSTSPSMETRRLWDVRAVSALELGLVFAILTLLTGMLFSDVQWGAWWQWDPRQSSFLLATLIYAAYFVVRAAYADPEKRASNSAAYMMAATLPLLFLIYVYPRLPDVLAASFHPSNTVMGGLLKGGYAWVTWFLVTALTLLSVWLYRLRVRAGLLLLQLDNYERLATSGGGPAPTGVVRPISLSESGGENAESGRTEARQVGS